MMEERRSTGKSRRSPGRSAGNVPNSDLNSEDIAKTRAVIERAVKKKIETEKRAHQIVERLLEVNITEDFLVDCAKFISPSHYKDVIEERSIIKLCGYPICNNTLENVPKQKYKISTKTNKVYDITERKCFCSNFCYRASKYYEAQIPKSPVWSREEECPPVVKLLKEGRRGSSGEEVQIAEKGINVSEIEKPKRQTEEGNGSPVESDEDNEPEQAFVSSVIPEFPPHSVATETQQNNNPGTHERKTPDLVDINQNLSETTERLSCCHLNDHDMTKSQSCTTRTSEDVAKHKAETVQSSDDTCIDVMEVTQRAVSKSGAERLRQLLGKNRQTIKAEVEPVVVKRSMLEVLTQTLNEWKSEDTLRYLFGTNYVVDKTTCKRIVPDVRNQTEDLDEDDLCFDTNDINAAGLNECLPFQNENNASKPLPNYSKLKEETKMLEIRVKEFFKGHYILPEEVEDKQNEGANAGLIKNEKSWAPSLPLVDSCSQQQIRKRIVLEKLKKVLPAILTPLQVPYSDVCKELHNLIKTFRLTNKNITHTVPEWSVIAIVLLSVLLPTIPLHKDSQQNPSYTQFVSKLLDELHFEREDLEGLKIRFASNTLSSS